MHAAQREARRRNLSLAALVRAAQGVLLADSTSPALRASAVERWRRLLGCADVITHTYVVVESSALLQRRLGLDGAARFHRSMLAVAGVIPLTAFA